MQRLWGLRVEGLDMTADDRARRTAHDADSPDTAFSIDIRPADARAASESRPVFCRFDMRALLDLPAPDREKLD